MKSLLDMEEPKLTQDAKPENSDLSQAVAEVASSEPEKAVPSVQAEQTVDHPGMQARPESKLVPVLSLLVALASVLVSGWLQFESIDNNAKVKEYEVTFPLRHQNYAAFMQKVYSCFNTAYLGDNPRVRSCVLALEVAFFELEPLLPEDARASIWDLTMQYGAYVVSLANEENRDGDALESYFDSYIWYRTSFRGQLYSALFDDGVRKKRGDT